MPTSPTPKKRRAGVHLTDDERAIAQDKFLVAYAKTANISLACRAAKINRSTFYEWKKDDAFAEQLKDAEAEADDGIEAEIHRRAMTGVAEPLVSAGQLVYEYEMLLDDQGKPQLDSKGKPIYKRGKQISVRKYSDTLLIFYAKKHIPAYHDKSALDVTSNGATVGQLNLEQLAVLLTRTQSDTAAWRTEQGLLDNPL